VPKYDIDEELHAFFQSNFINQDVLQFVAKEANEIIATGAIIFYPFPPSYTNRTGVRGYIANMYTHKQYRGKGIAKKILMLLCEEAKARNVHALWLDASKDGRPVYEKFEFEEITSHMKLSGQSA